MTYKSLLAAATIGLALTQHAYGAQSVSSIAAAAALHAESRALAQGFSGVAVDIRPLDSRISLSNCDKPLSVASTGERILGPVSIAVSCRSPAPWTIHVRGTVAAEVSLPILIAPISRGDIISESDVQLQEQRITRGLVGYVSDIDDIVGKEARKHLSAGSKLRKSDLVAPQLIDRGQSVDLIARSSGLTVNMQGTALANGAAGERLLVKNVSSGKRIEGLILSDGSVLIQ